MMQDYPRLLSSAGEVGFTMYETWYCFSPAKNNIKDAAACITKGIPSYGAAEAEYNFFNWTNKMIAAAGHDVQLSSEKSNFNGMQFAFGPKVVMDPMFAITFHEIKTKFTGKCVLRPGSTLVLLDKEVYFENLDLEGSMVCRDGKKIPGPPISFQASNDSDAEIFRIRGYKL